MNVLNLELQPQSPLLCDCHSQRKPSLDTVFIIPLTFLTYVFNCLQLEVHEAKPVPENHPQWDTAVEGDEDQEDSEGFEDSFEEEEEEEEGAD